MANSYFQCKQFIVHQEHTAMKVCTDACLFGAWVAKEVANENVQSILDIGTGTGLLSLMLAQTTVQINPNVRIVSVEIEKGAAAEAASNFNASPWASNLHLVHSSIQEFSQQFIDPFDCIITNPPFFEGDLQSPDDHKNLALHSAALPWTELIHEVDALLQPNGHYYVLIPALRAYTMQKLAEQKGIQLVEEVVVYNAAKQKPIRVMQKFIKTKAPVNEIKRSNFFIKDHENNYTTPFVELLSPYYLHL